MAFWSASVRRLNRTSWRDRTCRQALTLARLVAIKQAARTTQAAAGRAKTMVAVATQRDGPSDAESKVGFCLGCCFMTSVPGGGYRPIPAAPLRGTPKREWLGLWRIQGAGPFCIHRLPRFFIGAFGLRAPFLSAPFCA